MKKYWTVDDNTYNVIQVEVESRYRHSNGDVDTRLRYPDGYITLFYEKSTIDRFFFTSKVKAEQERTKLIKTRLKYLNEEMNKIIKLL